MPSRLLLALALAFLIGACTAADDASDTTAPSPDLSSSAPPAIEGPETTAADSETTTGGSETTRPTVDETLDVEVPDAVAPTPSTPEGPYYPTEFPVDVDADLVVYGDGAPASGDVLELSGAVVGTDGERIEGAAVEIWQADANGVHPHSDDPGFGDHDPDFQGIGFTTTNANGAYLLRTVVPGASEEGSPHINLKVYVEGREVLNTRLYLAGEGVTGGGPGDVPPELVTEVTRGESALEATFVVAVDI
jgi:protocatechuate 3,4-dioxygenase beta subunit